MHDDQKNWAQLRHRLDEVLDEAMQADGAAFGKIRVRDPRTNALTICAQRGLSREFLERYGSAEPSDETVCAEVLRSGRRVVVPDLAHDTGRARLANLGRIDGFRGLQATPIVGADGAVVGTLSTLFAGVYRPSKAAEMVLDYCARKAAGIIEQARRAA